MTGIQCKNEVEATKESFVEKYGSFYVKFYSYYKYTFVYARTIDGDGKRLIVRVGGDADDIYRLDVDADFITIADLSDVITSGGVYVNNEAAESFYCF